MASAMRRLALSTQQLSRRFTTTVVRQSHAQEEGIVGYFSEGFLNNNMEGCVIYTAWAASTAGYMTYIHHIVDQNLPFDIHNRYKLAAVMTLYFTSGLTAPLIVIRYNLLKAADS